MCTRSIFDDTNIIFIVVNDYVKMAVDSSLLDQVVPVRGPLERSAVRIRAKVVVAVVVV